MAPAAVLNPLFAATLVHLGPLYSPSTPTCCSRCFPPAQPSRILPSPLYTSRVAARAVALPIPLAPAAARSRVSDGIVPPQPALTPCRRSPCLLPFRLRAPPVRRSRRASPQALCAARAMADRHARAVHDEAALCASSRRCPPLSASGRGVPRGAAAAAQLHAREGWKGASGGADAAGSGGSADDCERQREERRAQGGSVELASRQGAGGEREMRGEGVTADGGVECAQEQEAWAVADVARVSPLALPLQATVGGRTRVMAQGAAMEEHGGEAARRADTREHEGEWVQGEVATEGGGRATSPWQADSPPVQEWSAASALSHMPVLPVSSPSDLSPVAGVAAGSPPVAMWAAGITAHSPSAEGTHSTTHAHASPSPSTHSLQSTQPSLLVFSGGTAFNAVAEEVHHWTPAVAHVLPVSDDGGSTAEIVRVIGGPAIGDIRSRCLRLSDASTHEARAVRRLLGHRLPLHPTQAKAEWLSIVEGEHELWRGVSQPYMEIIRAFLVHFQYQILRNAGHKFCFQHGSVGNFFFSGARSFFRSLDAAIFLFSRVSNIPHRSLVLPCVCTNDRFTLGAELFDGSIIRGQNEISHPSVLDSPRHLPLSVDKTPDASPPLPAPIRRVFYMSSEGNNLLHEVFPSVNPRVLDELAAVDAVVYGIGSLFTSICPSLILRGVGEAIAARACPKVLILNGSLDRETAGMAASDFVLAISNCLNRTFGDDSRHRLAHPPMRYVSHLIAPEGGAIPLDRDRLAHLGVTSITMVPSSVSEGTSEVYYDVRKLVAALRGLLADQIPSQPRS